MVTGGAATTIQPEPSGSELFWIAVGIATALVHGRLGKVEHSSRVINGLSETSRSSSSSRQPYLIARGHYDRNSAVANGGFFPHPETVYPRKPAFW